MRKALENYDGLRPSEDSRTVRECAKGDTLFLEREYPPYTPERKDEGPSPSTPHIGSFNLEELHALRNVGAVYMASP